MIGGKGGCQRGSMITWPTFCTALVQYSIPIFENFSMCFGLFQGEKYTFPQKFSKIGLVAEKPKMIKTIYANMLKSTDTWSLLQLISTCEIYRQK